MSLQQALQKKYAMVAHFYDLLNYPWERRYRKWRPEVLMGIHGEVLELGVGTGKNFAYYAEDVRLTGVDLSDAMLARAEKCVSHARCSIRLLQQDVTHMTAIASSAYDWVVSTFVGCLIPGELQANMVTEIARVLKPGARFRLLEIVYSRQPGLRRCQQVFAPLIEKIYGARFDRDTRGAFTHVAQLQVTHTTWLKYDTHLLIEGVRLS